MTMRDGKGECDGCGRDIGNAGVDQAVVVTTLDNDGAPLTLHLCRQPLTADDDPRVAQGTTVLPCAGFVLDARGYGEQVFRHFATNGGSLPRYAPNGE